MALPSNMSGWRLVDACCTGLPLASTSVGAGDHLQLLGFNMTPVDLAIAAGSVCCIQFPDADDGIAGCGKEDSLILLATLRARLCVARKFDPKKRTLPSTVRSQIT